MVEQILHSQQVKRRVIIGNKLYIRVASQVADQLKTKDLVKLGSDREISKVYRIIA